jgi:hypothetical protein
MAGVVDVGVVCGVGGVMGGRWGMVKVNEAGDEGATMGQTV